MRVISAHCVVSLMQGLKKSRGEFEGVSPKPVFRLGGRRVAVNEVMSWVGGRCQKVDDTGSSLLLHLGPNSSMMTSPFSSMSRVTLLPCNRFVPNKGSPLASNICALRWRPCQNTEPLHLGRLVS